MKLGLSSYTFGWAVGAPGHAPPDPLNELDLLEKCRRHGVSVLQIGDNLPLHTFDQTRLSRLATQAQEQGVQLEVGARGLTEKRLAEYIDIAQRVKARLVRFVIDDVDYHPDPRTVATLLGKAPRFMDEVVLGIENHDRFAAATLRTIVESAGSDRIGVCLDTANSLGAGEGLETVLRELAPLTVNLHLKDFHIARVPSLMGFTVEGRPAGSGFLNIPKLLEQLRPFGRCQTAILELWTPPEPRLEDTIRREETWAVQSLEFLKPLLPA